MSDCTGKIKTLAPLVLLSFAALSAAAAANFPVGTHIVKGSARGNDENGRNILLSSQSGVTIRAVNTNGHVIAESVVRDASEEGVNFSLRIPLSTSSTDSTCAVGDKLNCVMASSDAIAISTEPLTVGGATSAQTIALKVQDVKSFVSPDGGVTNQVAQAYVDAIQAWMSDEDGFVGASYDPFADYDNDGVSNYSEYLAGTNPFDSSDRLKIKSFAMDGGVAAISFEYVGGHVYGVRATPDLSNPAWLSQKVRTKQDGSELSQVMPSNDPDGLGETTIYMTPATDSAHGFFTLEAK